MTEQASTSQSVNETDCKTPWPAYSEFFAFEPKLSTEKNFAFTCKLCLLGKKVIHANKSSTANLKKHINIPMDLCNSTIQYSNSTLNQICNIKIAKHPHHLKNLAEIKSKLANKRQNENVSDNNAKKQCVLQKWGSGRAEITQKKINDATLRFVIENIQPLSVVESPAFIDLVKIGLPPSIRIMCKKTLREKLIQLYFHMKTTLENQLADIETVSTTADLWSKAKRSYLVFTIHWINQETLKRESAALACRRIKGKHTFDVLAKAINSIFCEYHIQNKVCCTTTDNGTNFVKAFRDFEKQEDDEETNIEFHDLYNILLTDEGKDLDAEDFITLPPHHRCVSHTLNLVAAKDSEKAFDNDTSYKRKHRIIFAKLSKLWNKQNQSTQVADKIKDICGIYLKTPVITRWNSTFDSVYQIVTLLKDGSEKINQCLDYCNLQRLKGDEIKFLDEYCQAMEPLAKALDILQSDVGMYMGFLLPVLFSLQNKLENILNKLTDCQALVTAIQQGLKQRFCTTFEKKELIIASCLHPKFKLNWINGEKKNLAESYLKDLLGIHIHLSDNTPNLNKNDCDDFFTFHQQSTCPESAEEELERFLKSKRTDVELLQEFPNLKKLFIKFNTALPSSASVERLFSIANSVLSHSRGRLHDNIMEYQLLLNVNKKYQ